MLQRLLGNHSVIIWLPSPINWYLLIPQEQLSSPFTMACYYSHMSSSPIAWSYWRRTVVKRWVFVYLRVKSFQRSILRASQSIECSATRYCFNNSSKIIPISNKVDVRRHTNVEIMQVKPLLLLYQDSFNSLSTSSYILSYQHNFELLYESPRP